ncbi:MAG: hypothetical protein AAF466_14200 [Bacteroidota bacterium]
MAAKQSIDQWNATAPTISESEPLNDFTLVAITDLDDRLGCLYAIATNRIRILATNPDRIVYADSLKFKEIDSQITAYIWYRVDKGFTRNSNHEHTSKLLMILSAEREVPSLEDKDSVVFRKRIVHEPAYEIYTEMGCSNYRWKLDFTNYIRVNGDLSDYR